MSMKKCIKTETKEFSYVVYDGTEECMADIKAMCKKHECAQCYEEGFLLSTMNGVVDGKIGDYIVCGDCCCIHPVSKEYFEEHYKVID